MLLSIKNISLYFIYDIFIDLNNKYKEIYIILFMENQNNDDNFISNIESIIEIPIESIREDEIVGEHTITFDSDEDLIEITHSAKTRDILAKGALKAAKFVTGKPAGLYTMKDVLAL